MAASGLFATGRPGRSVALSLESKQRVGRAARARCARRLARELVAKSETGLFSSRRLVLVVVAAAAADDDDDDNDDDDDEFEAARDCLRKADNEFA